MGLRINNNLEALDTLRNLNTAQSMFSQSIQRLSSGKRINSAADDAAGYAISQKLLAQTNGLNQASSNAQDGISLVQTANGGLQTIQNMLQRFRQLAVQSANDTNTSSDRTALQNEADQINQEITQIASTTQFNSKTLLSGSLSSTGAVTAGTLGNLAGITASNYTINAGTLSTAVGYALTVTTAGTQAASNLGVAKGAGATLSTDYIGNAATLAAGTAGDGVQAGSHTLTIAGALGSSTLNLTAATASGMTFGDVVNAINSASAQTGVTASFNGAATTAGITLKSTSAGSAQGFTVTGDVASTLTGLGLQVSGATTTVNTATAGTDGAATLTGGSIVGTLNLVGKGNVFADASTGLSINFSASTTLANASTATLNITNSAANLQVGANANQSIAVNVGDMRAAALGVQSATAANSAIDISSGSAAATAAISTIDAAISKVSSQASLLGSVQNRLTAAVSNLSIGAENLTAAYSAITNVNMAQETTALATAQILNQSSTAMLAQSNQAPQGVLKLLG